jgi:hypothetical protein
MNVAHDEDLHLRAHAQRQRKSSTLDGHGHGHDTRRDWTPGQALHGRARAR